MKSSIKYRIFLFLCVLLAGVILYSAYQLSLRSNAEKISHENKNPGEKTAEFMLQEKNGLIEVYTYPGMQLFDRMYVEKSLLPKDIREKLKTGYFLPDKAALFDFLESYSS